MGCSPCYSFFFFNDTATTEIYTLSLHDALPIYWSIRKAIGSITRRSKLPAGSNSSAKKDRKSTRLNSSHLVISYAVFCLKKKKKNISLLRLIRPPAQINAYIYIHTVLLCCVDVT